MTPTEITSLAMAIAAILGATFQIFSNRRSNAKITGGSEATSWGELVASLQDEMDRRETRCQEQITGLTHELHAAESRIHDLEEQLETKFFNEVMLRRTRKLNRELGGE